MKHLEIEEIIEKRFEKISEAFDKARLHFQQDDIRIFRVKVKKLSACLQLIEDGNNNGHSLKLPPNMVKLDHLFGTIRSLQMQQGYIQDKINQKDISSPDNYLKFLSDHILKHMEAAGQQVKGIESFKKEKEKLLGLLPKQLSRKDILQFVRSEGDILETLFAPTFPTDKSFHNARKHLKILLYISPYADLEIAALSPYKLLSSFEAIDEFTKLLGKFQDMDTVLDSLYLSIPKIDIDENEKISLRRLEQIWVEAREVFRLQIYDQLQLITATGGTAGPLVLV